MASEALEVDADGRAVRVSSPDRVLFPAHDGGAAITKLDVVRYYVAVADGILRALRDRPTTLERWPKGVHPGLRLSNDGKGDAFYQKRMIRGAPDWVPSARITFPSGREADELCPDHIAVIAWAAQMGAITFHPWPVRAGDPDHPDELRIDLDPHGSTGFADVKRVAFCLREILDELGLLGYVKTSGKGGLHVYVRIEPRWDFIETRHAGIALGRELMRRDGGVTLAWWKEERGDTVFVDYNQNARDRTIAGAYSLRPAPGAPVSTPVTWDELEALDDPRAFTLHTVPDRLAQIGDPHATIDDTAFGLDTLLAWWNRDVENGEGELVYPPDYPKMPGEPKRVQPSKARPE